jgi:hypothetical protein
VTALHGTAAVTALHWTAAVTALHGTHAIKIFSFFYIKPVRGDCNLTWILCLMNGHIILSDNLVTLHTGITSLNSNAICQELGSTWICSIYSN